MFIHVCGVTRLRAVQVGALILLSACSSGKSGEHPPISDFDGNGIENPVDAGSIYDTGAQPDPIDGSLQPPTAALVIEPDDMKLSVGLEPQEPVGFAARLSTTGDLVDPVKWTADHPELGAIDRATGKFSPTGIAGTVYITATANSLQATTTLVIKVAAKQQGDPDSGSKPVGAGGLGGVGGEGGGAKISDPKLLEALDKSPQSDAELNWLYPYDATVWPRGMPAPLLQWSSTSHAALAVKIHIEVDKSFSYDGYFAAPPDLAAGKPITRLPIPQEVWRRAQESGKSMSVGLVIAASDGAGGYSAFTPKANLSWTIAQTTMRGTVYYNSYGTKLAENFGGAKGGNGRFGGATLAIHGGAFDPVLVAGKTTNDSSGCRVCHVVSSDGSRMIAQQADNMVSSSYDLKDMNKETTYPDADSGKFGWAALSPDGAIALGNAGPPGTNSQNVSSLASSALYRVADGKVLNVQGMGAFVSQAATPAFSPDGDKLAFNFNGGPGTQAIAGDGRSLVVMDFKPIDADNYSVTNPRKIFTGQGEQRPGWPFFLPDGNSLIFQLELKSGASNERFATRLGARGELWWTDLDGQSHALDRANGKGYLPTGPSGHEDDTTLQYEPTVAPIVAGGYAWVVFTSRRMYGNVATRDPYESDARNFDLTSGNAAGPTTKKLWVTAIDMPPKPGTDPSHPAFYLPAQELYAGNSRGFWVLDACKSKNTGCSGGDECCGGYCRVTEEFSYAVCMDTPALECAMEYESCNVDADCCPSGDKRLSCIAGHCASLQLY
jgi:hypothetical protein